MESLAVSFGIFLVVLFPSINAQIPGLTQHVPDRAKEALGAAGTGKDAQGTQPLGFWNSTQKPNEFPQDKLKSNPAVCALSYSPNPSLQFLL